MRGIVAAAALVFVSCASAGEPPSSVDPHDDPLLDRYRSENFLDADRRTGSAVEAGARRSIPAAAAPATTDLHMRLESGSFALAARSRRRDAAAWEAYHAGWSPAGCVRVLGGDFVPDIGIGLVSSARRFAGAFTPSWPLAGSGLKRWTGFYERFIRGGAATIARGPASLSLLGGVAGSHVSEGTKAEGKTITGLRASASWTRAAAGVFLLSDEGDPGGTAVSLEGAARSGPATVTAELSIAGGEAGAAWGCAVRSRTVRAAALLYNAPRGSTGPFSHLPGATQRSAASRSGASAALHARLPGRCFFDLSVERHGWRDGYESGSGSDARLALELRRRSGTLRLALRDDIGREIDCLPVPPLPPGRTQRRRSVELSALIPAVAGNVIRGSLRIAREDRSSGWLATAGAKFEPGRGAMRIEAGGSRCRSTRGRMVFRFHEPSIPGVYSWKIISDYGTRYYTVCIIRFRGLSACASLWWQEGAGSGGDASIVLKY